MGINAQGYFVTRRPLTDAEIARILDDFKYTYSEDWKLDFQSLRGRSEFTDRCVEINFDLDRIYSLGYARGPFVKHATVLGWLRRRPYIEAVYYGGDTVGLDEISEWTEEQEIKAFNLYLTSNTLSYHDKRNEREWFK